MRRLRTALTLLLAILWLPVTSHCLLFESIASPELLTCCSHETASTPESSHHQDDCASDACAVVEGAQYKSSLQRVIVPVLEHHILFELPAPHSTPATLAASGTLGSDDTLARLPGAWQFFARTALLPRAPSFVS